MPNFSRYLSSNFLQVIKLPLVTKVGESLLLKVLPDLHIEILILVFGNQY